MELLGLLHGEVMTFQPMAVRQISRGGMQVETRFAQLLDSLHEFRLTLGERSIVIKGALCIPTSATWIRRQCSTSRASNSSNRVLTHRA
jgi:hypothetical protein